MKKKILSLALIAISLVAFSSTAQTQSNSNQVTNSCRNDKNKKEGRCRQSNPFEGLNLTANQQAQLNELNANRKSARTERMKAAKTTRQKSDSSRIADRRADRKKYLEDVKAIIGPEQYVVFLENIVVNGGNQKVMSHKHNNKGPRQNSDNKKRQDRQKGNRTASQRQAQQASAATNI